MLAPLADGGARHLHTMRLLLRVHAALNHHDQMFSLARALVRRNALPRQEADQLIDASGAARPRRGRQRRLARHLERSEGRRAPAARDRAGRRRRLRSGGRGGRGCPRAGSGGRREVQSRAGRGLRPLRRLAGVPSRRAPSLAAIASDRSRAVDGPGHALPERPAVGPAERYLLRSVSRRNDAQTHALLGSLYDRLERPADAVRHWRGDGRQHGAAGAGHRRRAAGRRHGFRSLPRGRRGRLCGGLADWTTRPARSPATRPCRPPRPSPTMCWIPTPASARNSTTARWRPKTRSPAAPATSTSISTARRCRRFRGPGAHVRAGAARGCQARGRPGRSRADTKPPFKNDGEH